VRSPVAAAVQEPVQSGSRVVAPLPHSPIRRARTIPKQIADRSKPSVSFVADAPTSGPAELDRHHPSTRETNGGQNRVSLLTGSLEDCRAACLTRGQRES